MDFAGSGEVRERAAKREKAHGNACGKGVSLYLAYGSDVGWCRAQRRPTNSTRSLWWVCAALDRTLQRVGKIANRGHDHDG